MKNEKLAQPVSESPKVETNDDLQVQVKRVRKQIRTGVGGGVNPPFSQGGCLVISSLTWVH